MLRSRKQLKLHGTFDESDEKDHQNSIVQSGQWCDPQLHPVSLDVFCFTFTPPEHEVLLIDGNARAMNEQELARVRRIGQGEMPRSTKIFIR